MKKKKLIKIFLITVGICLGLLGVTAMVGITAYNVFIHEEEEVAITDPVGVTTASTVTDSQLNPSQDEGQLQDKTLVVLGTDKEGNRTDVIVVVHFSSKDNAIHVISVPRDTKVDWKEDQKACLPDYYQGLHVSKINEMTHYSEMRHIRGTVVNEIEATLGTKVDHYAIVSLDAFRRIVDAVGGVDLDVPIRMKKDDYAQDLHIDLYPGFQHLDGDKAEQFVRFRDYHNGDVDRIVAQQAFLKVLADKIMSPQIITKIPQIIQVLFTSLRTDISFMELGEYIPYLKAIDLNKLYFHTLPGEGRYENGVSYYFKDMKNIETLANEVFFEN